MNEVEVKILEVNKQEVVEKLLSLGAKKHFDDEIKAYLFDFDDERIKNNNTILRLRLEGLKPVFTVKKRLNTNDSKSSSEYEVEVSSFEEMKKILSAIGLKETGKIIKHRTSYVLDNVRFEFDKFKEENDFVPEFLEIEANDEKTLFKYVKLLGFSKDDCKPWGGRKVCEYYKKV